MIRSATNADSPWRNTLTSRSVVPEARTRGGRRGDFGRRAGRRGRSPRRARGGSSPAGPAFAVTAACNQKDCLVDTKRTGDGNGGHLWGTDLSEPDRMALLEYLKTL